ncbi:MAG: ATP-dependent 6-phosphofructokinase [Thermodesulfobacteriota bacterium]
MEFPIESTKIESLGAARIPNPVRRGEREGDKIRFVSDEERVLVDIDAARIIESVRRGEEPLSFEKAGPRPNIFFDPSKLRCALVTCGGLCPGLNDIIRAIVLELYYGYGVRNIYGIRYGLAGFIPRYGYDIEDMTPDMVADIHAAGGTVLGSSRGPQEIGEIVDCLERMNVGILFTIGGDGTLVAAAKICDAIKERNLKISVVGVPKTIDNDIYMVERSFGFDTAVEAATAAIRSAHTEAQGYPNGVGLVKLMGRHSGFIAVNAALAQQDVNFVLIPEVDFDLEGERGFLAALENRLKSRSHAVVVVAEGAGQKFFEGREETRDASGNVRLFDIGYFLRQTIEDHFHKTHTEINLKYIDPSYMIRSLPANANDNVFCSSLARNAVHAGLAGKTRVLLAYWNSKFVHVPMDASAGRRKHILPEGSLWQSVLEATGQGDLKNR